MSDDTMMVNAEVLTKAAEQLRSTIKDQEAAMLRNGVKVTAAQLERAAALLSEAESSVITAASGSGATGVTLGVPQERPGFIHASQQDTDGVLVFNVGVLGSTHRIARDGTDAPADPDPSTTATQDADTSRAA